MTYGWNAIAKAVAICSDIGIPALIGGFRLYSLLDSQAMLETQHRWCAFGLVTLYREDDTIMTDALNKLYHNQNPRHSTYTLFMHFRYITYLF